MKRERWESSVKKWKGIVWALHRGLSPGEIFLKCGFCAEYVTGSLLSNKDYCGKCPLYGKVCSCSSADVHLAVWHCYSLSNQGYPTYALKYAKQVLREICKHMPKKEEKP